MEDHYATLRVMRAADSDLIEMSYHRLKRMKKREADQGLASSMFADLYRIEQAYSVLGDGEARRRYDQERSPEHSEPPQKDDHQEAQAQDQAQAQAQAQPVTGPTWTERMEDEKQQFLGRQKANREATFRRALHDLRLMEQQEALADQVGVLFRMFDIHDIVDRTAALRVMYHQASTNATRGAIREQHRTVLNEMIRRREQARCMQQSESQQR